MSLSFPSLPIIQPFFPSYVSQNGLSPPWFFSVGYSPWPVVLFEKLSCSRRSELVPAGRRSKNPILVKSPNLITKGPYSVVRHPSYTPTGAWINFIGIVLVHSWIFSEETG
ncbi:hypothetical protein L218DRAFT_1661 [Marasmius fiardii PR-910]|nr:hypothetical protein L218DRAFT_1661 [Marasmius fiardii PR-910]